MVQSAMQSLSRRRISASAKASELTESTNSCSGRPAQLLRFDVQQGAGGAVAIANGAVSGGDQVRVGRAVEELAIAEALRFDDLMVGVELPVLLVKLFDKALEPAELVGHGRGRSAELCQLRDAKPHRFGSPELIHSTA